MHDLTCFISLPLLIHKTCPDYLSLLSLIISFSFCTAAFSLTSSFQTLRATMSGFSSWCRTFISVFQPPKANSAFQGFHPSGVGKWVPASGGKAKAGMVYSVSRWNRGVQVKLWDPMRTCAIPERLKLCFGGSLYKSTFAFRVRPIPQFTDTSDADTFSLLWYLIPSTDTDTRSYMTTTVDDWYRHLCRHVCCTCVSFRSTPKA